MCSQHYFFFQAEDGIRDYKVTGVQTCALPISAPRGRALVRRGVPRPPEYGPESPAGDRPGYHERRGARAPQRRALPLRLVRPLDDPLVRAAAPAALRNPRLLEPAHQPLAPDAVLQEFLSLRDALTRRVRQADGLDLQRAIVVSPVSRFFRMPLGGYFAFLLAHDRRHLWQARQALGAGAAPE